ncbi:MAG TPA: hypothetical protein VGI75_05780 [Pirellulales bacterium]
MRIRKRLFVDHKVQGVLMLRAVVYWLCCLATFGLALLAWELLTGPNQPLLQYFVDAWHYFLPTAIVSVGILPLLLYDILKLSNRFTGPLFRLRRELRRLAAGETVAPIRFRIGDFWPELADEFNATSQRMEMLAAMAENGCKIADRSERTSAGTPATAAASSQKRGSAVPVTGTAASNPLQDGSLPDQLFDLPRSTQQLS